MTLRSTDLFWLDRVGEIDGGQAIFFFLLLLLIFVLRCVTPGRHLADGRGTGGAVGGPASLWTGLLLGLAAVCLLLLFRGGGGGGGVTSIGVPGVRQSAQYNHNQPDYSTMINIHQSF